MRNKIVEVPSIKQPITRSPGFEKKESAKQKSEEGNEHRMPQPSLG